MALFYYRAPAGNFGDDLNEWLWPRLIPEALHAGADVQFVGIGSILDGRMPAHSPVVVFGAGVRRRETVPEHRANWDIRFVRGPLSAGALGLGPDGYITDAAAALRLTDAPTTAHKVHRFALMPHWLSMPRADWQRICRSAGITLIDPRNGPEAVLREIARTRFLISEAMHGAIVADALRVPWLRVRCATHRTEAGATEFKWEDWTRSMGLHHQAVVLPYMPCQQGGLPKKILSKAWAKAFERSLTSRITQATRGEFQLSDDNVLSRALDRMAEQLEALRRDYGSD